GRRRAAGDRPARRPVHPDPPGMRVPRVLVTIPRTPPARRGFSPEHPRPGGRGSPEPGFPMSDNFFDRQRAALARLAAAVRSRAETEAAFAFELQAAADKAEREVSRARKANAAAREKELGEVDAANAAAAADIAGRFDAEQFATNRTPDERPSPTTHRFKTAQQKGETEYRDKLWSLDSILEAHEKKAKDQQEALKRKAAAGTDEVEGLWKEADPLLVRGRVQRTEVEHGGDLAPADEDDPINRMQKAIKASEAAVETLRGLFLPKLANVGIIALVVTLAVAAIAFVIAREADDNTGLDIIWFVCAGVVVGAVLG